MEIRRVLPLTSVALLAGYVETTLGGVVSWASAMLKRPRPSHISPPPTIPIFSVRAEAHAIVVSRSFLDKIKLTAPS